MSLTEAQLEEVRTVAEDLESLRDDWEPELKPPALRRLSPIIRRLLIDDDLGKAWRLLGLPGQPYLSASDLDAMLGTIDRTLIVATFAPPGASVGFAMAGGGQMQIPSIEELQKGSLLMMMTSATLEHGPTFVVVPPDRLNAIHADPNEAARREVQEAFGRRLIRGMPLAAFLDSAAAMVLGTTITRRDIVKYVANKLGGAHFDAGRDRKKDAKFELLDKHPLTCSPNDGPSATFAYVELLSIAEAIAESGDAARLIDAFAKAERQAKSASATPPEA